MKQVEDFCAECAVLERLLEPMTDPEFDRSTGFKGWTINQILRHLHLWNYAAYMQLTNETELGAYLAEATEFIKSGTLPAFEEACLKGISGRALFDTWKEFYPKMANAFAAADPAQRLVWAGPDMSARSSVTARLMETWAHSQAIYDELGVDRESSDGIENIVVLGLNTYGWTFANRKLPVPEPRPTLILTAPSGAIWKKGGEAVEERLEGSAEEFCQVVTQCRNIADTHLKVTGENAARWMRIAQCFAGPPSDPPGPGVRAKKQRRE